jgi:hypothetical protein
LVNDLGICSWADNPLRAVSLWTVNHSLKSKMALGGTSSNMSIEETVYAEKCVRYERPIFLSGELVEVPGGVKQKLWKGCAAIPIRLPLLRVYADNHGFDGNYVSSDSSTKIFALSYYLESSKEPGFIDDKVSVNWETGIII